MRGSTARSSAVLATIVNATLAQRFWNGGANAIAKRIRVADFARREPSGTALMKTRRSRVGVVSSDGEL